MKTAEYKALALSSDDLSDQFYRSVSQWARGDERATREHCLKLGDEYKRSLERELAYLRSREDLPENRRQIESCQRFLTILDTQIQMLSRNPSQG